MARNQKRPFASTRNPPSHDAHTVKPSAAHSAEYNSTKLIKDTVKPVHRNNRAWTQTAGNVPSVKAPPSPSICT